jgi:hypothetical protein
MTDFAANAEEGSSAYLAAPSHCDRRRECREVPNPTFVIHRGASIHNHPFAEDCFRTNEPHGTDLAARPKYGARIHEGRRVNQYGESVAHSLAVELHHLPFASITKREGRNFHTMRAECLKLLPAADYRVPQDHLTRGSGCLRAGAIHETRDLLFAVKLEY